MHRPDGHSNNSCIIADAEVNFSSFNAFTLCHSMHRIAYMSNRSGIKYPRINIRVSEKYFYNMNNKRTRGGRTVLQRGEVQLAIPLPVSLLVITKALIICSWSRFSLGCRVWLRVRNLSLALLLPRRTFLLVVGLFWIAITWPPPVLFLMSLSAILSLLQSSFKPFSALCMW